jgi:hypothetical protein
VRLCKYGSQNKVTFLWGGGYILWINLGPVKQPTELVLPRLHARKSAETNAFPVNDSHMLAVNISDKFDHGSFNLFELFDENIQSLYIFSTVFNGVHLSYI